MTIILTLTGTAGARKPMQNDKKNLFLVSIKLSLFLLSRGAVRPTAALTWRNRNGSYLIFVCFPIAACTAEGNQSTIGNMSENLLGCWSASRKETLLTWI